MRGQQSFIQQMQEHLNRQQYYKLISEDLFERKVEFHLDNQELRIIQENEMQDQSTYFRIGKDLYELHVASIGFPVSNNHPFATFGKWPENWVQRLKRLEKYKEHLFQSGIYSQFEELFLENYTYFSRMVQVALFYLEDHDYPNTVSDSLPLGTLSYRSLSWNDIEVTEGKNQFIRPENWVLDIPARDLGQFIRNSAKDQAGLEETVEFLKGYQNNRELTPGEYHLIYCQMIFPGDYVKLTEGYFNRKVNPDKYWDERMLEVIKHQEHWENVLCSFPERIKAAFGVEITQMDWLNKTTKVQME